MKAWIALLSLVALPAFAATTQAPVKTGGSTLVAPTPDPGSVRMANEELRNSGTASTGGTGTTLENAGEGSTSNTTGTGSVGSASGSGTTTKTKK